MPTRFLIIALLLCGSVAIADGPEKKEKTNRETRRVDLDAEQTKAALGFAREHHPELADLLTQLRKSNPLAFREAITDLHRSRQQIEKIAERAPERAEIMRDLWKVDSRTRLLAARMSMSDDDALDTQLRNLLAERVKLKKRQHELELERLRQRLASTRAALDRLETEGEAMIERDFQRLRNQVRPRKN